MDRPAPPAFPREPITHTKSYADFLDPQLAPDRPAAGGPPLYWLEMQYKYSLPRTMI